MVLTVEETLGELCEVKVLTLKGTEVSLSYIQCFLYLVSLTNVSIFQVFFPRWRHT